MKSDYLAILALNSIIGVFPLTVLFSQEGSLDPSFGGDGKVTTVFPGLVSNARAVVVQDDGKIVVAGGSAEEDGTNWNFALARYNTDGSLDDAFGIDGLVSTDLGGVGAIEVALSVAIDHNGKIIACGNYYGGAVSGNDFAMVRYNSDGTLDNTFDGDGIVTTDVTGFSDISNSLAVLPDGRIVVTGYGGAITEEYDIIVARYNYDGSLDNTFDSDGIVVTDMMGLYLESHEVVIQSDSKIVVAGTAGEIAIDIGDPSWMDIMVLRYNADGTLDYSFDTDGINISDFGMEADAGYSVDLQTDGKILIGGQTWTASGYDFALLRLNQDGTPDNTFDLDGTLTTDFSGSWDNCYTVRLQSDGKIVAAGKSGILPNKNFCVSRYFSDGSLDYSFDLDGKVSTDFGVPENYGRAMNIQTDGKILVVGDSSVSVFDQSFAIARYISTISLDNSEMSFDTDLIIFPNPSGEVVQIVWNSSSEGQLKIITADGKTLKNEIISGPMSITGLPAGIYIAEITTVEKTKRQKFIVE